ncbi:MAG: ABC transporter permease, partial [Clostridiaceae bacterium]
MQVFKVYFKVIKANIRQIMIYLIIFLAISLIYTFSAPAKNAGSFSQTRINAAFINLGKDTVLTKGFKEYLSKYVNFVDIENNQERLQDALFFRDVEYIVTIPENFTEDFLRGKSVEVEKTVGLDSASRMYVDMAINKYFNAARVYVNSIPGITEETLVR